MIGRGNRDSVDVLAIEELAVILVDRAVVLGGESVGPANVDIAASDDAAQLGGPLAVPGALVPHADRGHVEFFVLRIGSSGNAGPDMGEEPAHRPCRDAEKTSSIQSQAGLTGRVNRHRSYSWSQAKSGNKSWQRRASAAVALARPIADNQCAQRHLDAIHDASPIRLPFSRGFPPSAPLRVATGLP